VLYITCQTSPHAADPLPHFATQTSSRHYSSIYCRALQQVAGGRGAFSRCFQRGFHNTNSERNQGSMIRTSLLIGQFPICRFYQNSWNAFLHANWWGTWLPLISYHLCSQDFGQDTTETAVLRVLSDILLAADCGDVSAFVLLDMTAAFDNVDHTILLQRLQLTFGIGDTVHRWFQSYLSGRKQHVRCGPSRSSTTYVVCGVPQGSVLDRFCLSST